MSEQLLIEFGEDTELGRFAITVKNGIRIKNELETLENGAGINRMKLNRQMQSTSLKVHLHSNINGTVISASAD